MHISHAKVLASVSCGVGGVPRAVDLGVNVIRMRDDVPVSAQAFATVVTPMRPLVP